MLTLRMPSSIIAAGLATCLLAACDNGEVADPQAEESEEVSGKEALTGTLDRNFAGEDIPAVTVTDPQGIELSLGELDGQPVLLNLWATWCAPCVVEMPLLDELATELGDDVRVLTVSEDLRGAEVVVPFFEERGFANLPQWMDAQNELAFAFGGGAVLPLTILYDGQGKEVWRVIGAYDWGSAQAREAVMEAVSSE